ncbi:MAG: hypothetical protein VKJ46_00425 [Leptolyngbyaceae bacterium]|nr:hypothetical protein [Leptolyngbyaceae bacterium]
MAHTFLIEVGRWNLQGSWLDRDKMPILVKGKTLVGWSRDDWFTMVTKLIFPGSEDEEEQPREGISLQYRGRIDSEERRYTFVLQHSQLGRVEGEGWIAPESIVQRFWVLGDKQRRTGFETLHRLSDDKYYMSSGLMEGHYLFSAMEATLEREAE